MNNYCKKYVGLRLIVEGLNESECDSWRYLAVDGRLSDDSSFIQVHLFLFDLLLLFFLFIMALFFFVNHGQLAIATLMAFTTLFSLLYFFKFMVICCRFHVCSNHFILIYHYYLLNLTLKIKLPLKKPKLQ